MLSLSATSLLAEEALAVASAADLRSRHCIVTRNSLLRGRQSPYLARVCVPVGAPPDYRRWEYEFVFRRALRGERRF